MVPRTLGNDYVSTFGEELANTISHGVMVLLATFALPFAAVWAYTHVDTVASVSVSVYMLSVLSMFVVSTLYHAMKTDTKVKEVFHVLDHIFIYVAIAGSYTPPALSIIGGWKGTLLVCLQWSVAVFGIFYKLLVKRQNQKISIGIYLVMGWAIVIFGPTIFRLANMHFLIWVFAGGVLYTIGAIIYGKKGFRYHHLVWHIFINSAAICHFVAFVFFLK